MEIVMFIGASLACFGGLTLEQSMKLYSQLTLDLNLNAVEIRLEKESKRPSLWHWEANAKIAEFLSNYEISGAHLPFVNLNPISPNPQIRDLSMSQIKDCIRIAADLGMSYTVMHARGFFQGLTDEQLTDEWIKILKELAEYAQDNSIILTLENADFFFNLEEIINIIKIINSNWIRMTLDIGHAHIRNVGPLLSFPIKDLGLRVLDLFLPFIFNINMPYEKFRSLGEFIMKENELILVAHIHDYNGRKDHLKIGEGKINFSFLSELNKKSNCIFIFESNNMCDFNDFSNNYNLFNRLINKPPCHLQDS